MGWGDHVWMMAGGRTAQETYTRGFFCQEFKLIGPGSWAQFADFELSYVSVFIKEEFPMGGLKMRKSLITDLIIPTLLSAPTESICLAGK